MVYSKWQEFCDSECMVRWAQYIQHGGQVGGVQRKRGHESVVEEAREARGRELRRGGKVRTNGKF